MTLLLASIVDLYCLSSTPIRVKSTFLAASQHKLIIHGYQRISFSKKKKKKKKLELKKKEKKKKKVKKCSTVITKEF